MTPKMTAKQTVLSFIQAINAHDIQALGGLMTEDHRFIDAHANEVTGREQMSAGWRGYFEWFPDYHIEVSDIFDNENEFGMFGFAGGSFKGRADRNGRLPAAWKAIVRDGQIALWQVFADTKIPFETMSASN
jgi:ketosteroid isomerase-like protein